MKKLGILVSGRGSNMRAIMDACEQGRLSAAVAVVISNNQDAAALKIARERGINTAYLSSQTHADPEQLDLAMQTILAEHQVDLVLLAGFMKKIGEKTLAAYKGKILNIHPSLLPKFGGKGMYGLSVHEAVIEAGERESGVTIHMLDGEYDEGEIVAQRSIKVDASDTAESLAAKLLQLEHVFYAETVQKIIDGRIVLSGKYTRAT